MSERVCKCVCACVELILVKREKERGLAVNFLGGLVFGQGKMSRALRGARRDEEKDGGEEGADEKVSKDGVKQKKRGGGGGEGGRLWELVRRGA